MVEYGNSNRPMLCLIDEIFKGTNSADRIIGAEAVIRRLTGPGHLTIVPHMTLNCVILPKIIILKSIMKAMRFTLIIV